MKTKYNFPLAFTLACLALFLACGCHTTTSQRSRYERAQQQATQQKNKGQIGPQQKNTSQNKKAAQLEIPINNTAGQNKLYFKVYMDKSTKPFAPMDVSVYLNDKLLVSRNFSLGRDSYDGQYLINMPRGTYTIHAISRRAGATVTKSYTINNDLFIELSLTKGYPIHLTPRSKLSIARFALKRFTQPPDKNFNPALWLRMPDWTTIQASTPKETENK